LKVKKDQFKRSDCPSTSLGTGFACPELVEGRRTWEAVRSCFDKPVLSIVEGLSTNGGGLFLLLLAVGAPLSAAKVVNRTIATVNGEAIQSAEFDKNWEAFVEQQKAANMPAEKMTAAWEAETKKKMLDQMIDDKLLLQEAKKRKLRVNQRDLENGVLQVKGRFLPPSGKAELEKIVKRMLDARPKDSIDPNDPTAGIDLSSAWKELQTGFPKAIQDAEDKFKEELVKEGLTQKQFEDRIKDQLSVVKLTSEEVRARTKEPSDDSTRLLFERVVKVMDGKEIEGVNEETKEDIQSLARYFSGQNGEQVRARHILIAFKPDASFKEKSAARAKAEDLRKKIAAGADFAALAEKNSDDTASAREGGDLGYFGKGQMVESFEKAAFGLTPGKISPVVESDFGYHIIKVEAKKDAGKLKYEDVKPDLKEYLYRAQAQGNFEGFIKDIRDKASIKRMETTEASSK